MRKLLIIVLIIFVAIGGYWLFIGKNKVGPDGQPTGITTFFPLGNDTIPDGMLQDPNQEPLTGSTPGTGNEQLSQFKQLASRPVAGFTLFKRQETRTIPAVNVNDKPRTETVTESVIRYVSRASGYVYEVKEGWAPLQISNIYIPNIYEAYFLDDNKTALLRHLRADGRTIATYSVPIPESNPDGTRTQKEGVYLQDNIFSVTPSPDGKFFSSVTTQSGNGIISTSNSTGTSKKQVISTPFREWLVEWPQLSNIYLQTKASSGAQGYLYIVEQSSQKLRRVLGNINGLTVSISPSGQYILYSQSTSGGFKAHILNTKNNSVKNLDLSILPEKCTWLKNEDLICAGSMEAEQAQYPDAWYAGVVTFRDSIYKIYSSTGTFDSWYQGGAYDMTSLQLDEDKNILYFINKPTGVLMKFTL